MKRIVLIYGLLLCLALSVAAQEKVVKLKIVETSDVQVMYMAIIILIILLPVRIGRAVWHEYTLLWRKNANNIRRI